MFGWIRSKRAQAPFNEPMAGLVFKDGEALFRVICKLGASILEDRGFTPALVTVSVKRGDGIQIVQLLLPDEYSPVEATGMTTGSGPALVKGDLVAFYPFTSFPEGGGIVGAIPLLLDCRFNDKGIAAREFFENGATYVGLHIEQQIATSASTR